MLNIDIQRVQDGTVGLQRDGQVDEQQRAISLVVRIAAFQAVDPGSNPGWRITFCSLKYF